MGNSLLNYLNQRLHEEISHTKGDTGAAGPVITISREVGCNGLVVARLLATELNKRRMLSEWKVLSKEIFYKSAQELNLEPEKIRKMFKRTDTYTFEQILKAFGDKRYKSEAKISNTVREVIHSLAVSGFNIIVGRAGNIIAQDIKNALHLRLVAPLEYRVANIMKNNNLEREEALSFIERVEEERIAFRKLIRVGNTQDNYFDLTINRASFSDQQVVEIIVHAIDMKHIFADYQVKMQYY